jgi:hypothetical protein
MIKLFMEAGLPWMSVLTIEFTGVMLAAWKAPGWVKEAGLIALVTGIAGTLTGFIEMGFAIAEAGEIAQGIILTGVRISLITALYGLIIYGVSLVIRLLQKPKLL